jgi:hypothetical protein
LPDHYFKAAIKIHDGRGRKHTITLKKNGMNVFEQFRKEKIREP